MTRRNWVKEFRTATATFDWPTVEELAHSYAEHLYAVPVLPDGLAPILHDLRQSLRYVELEIVADAALAHGTGRPAVRRYYAQSLADRGRPAAALRLFAELAADETLGTFDHRETRGGVGRCYKELFLAATDPARRREFLSRSLEAYLTTYWESPDQIWHGINAVALLARAEREGIDLTPQPPAWTDIAAAVLQVVDEAEPGTWTELTACEAAIALGWHDEAIARAEAFLATTPAGFTVAAFHRQLQTVWQLDTTSTPGSELFAQLRSALLEYGGGQVTVEPADVRLSRLDDDLGDLRLQRLLGTERFRSLAWYRTGLVRCRAVASIQDPLQAGVATGFLVAGRDLHPDLPPLVVLTNGHVVPERLEPDDTHLAFHGLDEDPVRRVRFRVSRQCWYHPSARPGLDTAILEPEGHPEGVEPMPVAAKLPPRPLDDRRAYLIGHPGGQAQPQFSLEDNILLDYDQQFVHYRSAAEHGSSGSPVLDDDWRLIGLHHGGGTRVPRLDKRHRRYQANEGITIEAIRRHLAEHPPDARPS